MDYIFLSLYLTITTCTNISDLSNLHKIKKYIKKDSNIKNKEYRKLVKDAYYDILESSKYEYILGPQDKFLMNFIPFLNIEFFINNIRGKNYFSIIKDYYHKNAYFIKEDIKIKKKY